MSLSMSTERKNIPKDKKKERERKKEHSQSPFYDSAVLERSNPIFFVVNEMKDVSFLFNQLL